MPAHAERVRPTSRRRAGYAEDEDLELLEGDDEVDIIDFDSDADADADADAGEQDVLTT